MDDDLFFEDKVGENVGVASGAAAAVSKEEERLTLSLFGALRGFMTVSACDLIAC